MTEQKRKFHDYFRGKLLIIGKKNNFNDGSKWKLVENL